MAKYTLTQIKNAFAFLNKERGFVIVKEEISESFGSILLVMESNDFKIRFVVDRGDDLYIEISPSCKNEEWFDLCVVKPFLVGSDLLETYELIDVVDFFKRYYSRIKDSFGSDEVNETVKQINKLRQQRTHKMFSQISGKKP